MEEVFVPLALFLTIFAILYVYYTTRAKERMALAEKATNANAFEIEDSRYKALKWGVFMVALSIGIIGGYALSQVINEVVAFFTAILLFGGMGLIAAYLFTNAFSQKEK